MNLSYHCILLSGGSEEDEATYNYSQREIVDEVEIGAAKKVFDLKLTQLGGYKIDFTRNGRHMIMGGQKGHLAEFDWQAGKLLTEINVSSSLVQHALCLCCLGKVTVKCLEESPVSGMEEYFT